MVVEQSTISFREVGQNVAQTWQELLDQFTSRGWPLLTIPLQLSEEFGGNAGLHIIRSIVPGTIPISFGYRQEPCGMERIEAVTKELGGSSISYRNMSKFPHPYT